MIVLLGPGARGPFATIFKWNGAKFEKFQQLFTEERAYGLKALRVDGFTFLAVARWAAETSLIHKWNGTAFNLFQRVPSKRVS